MVPVSIVPDHSSKQQTAQLMQQVYPDAPHTIEVILKDVRIRISNDVDPHLLARTIDGRCSFTNNLSENAIRPFAVGRKNWLFSDSVNGANASAVVYTMVEMAKAHDLNIYGYLKYLLEQRPSEEMTDEQLSELAPWSEKLQSIKDHK